MFYAEKQKKKMERCCEKGSGMDGLDAMICTLLFQSFSATHTGTLPEIERYSPLTHSLLIPEAVCMLIQNKIVPPEEKNLISVVLSYCFLKPYITYYS